MKQRYILELYTRPTCSDCQDAKKYLQENEIPYIDKDVGKNSSLEKELIQLSGTRIVPSFAFYKKGFLGSKKLVKNIIGFEMNKQEITTYVNEKLKTF